MSTRLFTVTVSDLGSYRITVAADTPSEAERIAKSILFEEMTVLPPEATILARDEVATFNPEASLKARNSVPS